MDLKINANLVRRWQKELNADPSSTKLVPVNVAHPVTASQTSAYLEINIKDRGSPLIANAYLGAMRSLNITCSHSRLRVSNGQLVQ